MGEVYRGKDGLYLKWVYRDLDKLKTFLEKVADSKILDLELKF